MAAGGGVAVSNLAPEVSREDVLYLFERYGEARARRPIRDTRADTNVCANKRQTQTQVVGLEMPRPGGCVLWYADGKDAAHVARVLEGAHKEGRKQGFTLRV
jgi:hypothetical protein